MGDKEEIMGLMSFVKEMMLKKRWIIRCFKRGDSMFKSPEVGRSLTSSKNTERFRMAREGEWH